MNTLSQGSTLKKIINMKKWLKFSLGSLVLVFIIGFTGIHFIAPFGILKPQKIDINKTPEQMGLSGSAITVTGNDGIKLKGYHITSQRDTLIGTMVLIHGIGGCKEHFLSLSEELSKLGIACFIFDGRAHGKSGGEFCTYGFKEKHDISNIIDEIKSIYPNKKLAIWGNSLGGAIAIQTMELDKRIDFGIIESTFTELDDIAYDYKKRILGIGNKSISDYVLDRAGKIADFEPKQVKPIESIKNIDQAILIAHGDADKNINVNYGLSLHEHAKSKNKELVIVEGGGHFGLFETGGSAYKRKLLNFITKNLSQ